MLQRTISTSIRQCLRKAALSTSSLPQDVDEALTRKTKLTRKMTRKEYTAENLKVVFDEIAHDDGTINRQQFMHAIAQLEESEMSKLSRSLSRNELSRSGSRGNVQVGLARANSRAVPLLFEDAPTLDDTVVVDDETHDKIETTKTLSEILPSRISTTMEVGVSKICKLKSTVQPKQDVASRFPSFPLSHLFFAFFFPFQSWPVSGGRGLASWRTCTVSRRTPVLLHW